MSVVGFQSLTVDLPEDSPELRFGLQLYEGGILRMKKVLNVNNITMILEGPITGVEELIIGRGGLAVLR